VPRWIVSTLLILATLALVPLACVARARVVHSKDPRIHIIQDMDNQGRFKSQQGNPLFADGRAMRAPVPGTVARGRLEANDPLDRGLADGEWVTRIPLPVDAALLERGQSRYRIFCSPCHGLSGYGDGIVAKRAERLQEGSWVPPASFHVPPASTRPDGHIFNTITNGIRNMSSYGAQIPVEDRWAIVAYVRALQRSQRGSVDDVPPQLRSSLR